MAGKGNDFKEKVSEGVTEGINDAKQVVGTAINKVNILGVKNFSSTIGFIIFIMGFLAVLGYGTSTVLGFGSGLVNRRPLPTNADPLARMGHAVGASVGTVGSYTFQGVAASMDQQVRYNYQTVGGQDRAPMFRNSDSYQPPASMYTLPQGGYVNTTYQYGAPINQGR